MLTPKQTTKPAATEPVTATANVVPAGQENDSQSAHDPFSADMLGSMSMDETVATPRNKDERRELRREIKVSDINFADQAEKVPAADLERFVADATHIEELLVSEIADSTDLHDAIKNLMLRLRATPHLHPLVTPEITALMIRGLRKGRSYTVAEKAGRKVKRSARAEKQNAFESMFEDTPIGGGKSLPSAAEVVAGLPDADAVAKMKAEAKAATSKPGFDFSKIGK